MMKTELGDQTIKDERCQYYIDNCIGYNIQWMENILRQNEVVLQRDKTKAAQMIASYLHMLEGEMRRYFDL